MSLGSVGGVPAGGIVIVADVVKVAKRAGCSIVLVKVEVGHLDDGNQTPQCYFPPTCQK